MSEQLNFAEIDTNEELLEQEEELFDEDLEGETPPSDIIAFNELRSCADLFRMYKSNQLKIDPDFQRNLVWSISAKSRFIDSLAKQLPIPSMCISLDYKTDQRLIIDGLQRISSIISFLNEDNWKISNIKDIDEKLRGKTPAQISKDNRDIFSKIENITIPVTVLRCDYSKKSHMKYLFTIFHRLNSGGNRLNNQEIRNCIYEGSFNNLLKALAKHERSQSFFNYEIIPLNKNHSMNRNSYRFQFEELYLRIFAFSEKLSSYKGKLATFLNDFMDDNKNISEKKVNQWEEKMHKTWDIVFNDNRVSKFSKSIIEAILYGVFNNLDNPNLLDPNLFKQKINELRSDENFSLIALKEGLASKEKVTARLNKAKEIFGY
ncbi:GmrSD restriction endonuclease domain-containing protein [Acinetobacter sp. X9]